MPIFGRFATHLQQLQKNKFENREFLKAEVAGSMGLSAVIARILITKKTDWIERRWI